MSVYSNKDYGKTSQLGKFYVDTSAYCETLTHCFLFFVFFDMLTPKPSAFFLTKQFWCLNLNLNQTVCENQSKQ